MAGKPKRKMTAAQKAAARVPGPAPAPQPAAAPAPARVKRTPKEHAKRAAVLIGALVLLCLLSFTLWTCNYSHETDVARASMSSSESLPVDDRQPWIAFGDPSAETGLVFYPGGKVAAEAYAPLMRGLAESGMFCVIAKMPFNLAFLDSMAASGIMEAYPDVGAWYVGGHSLGGVAACQWAAAHPGDAAGIILLASYPADDLSGSGLRVLSIYGSNDQVMNPEAYERARGLLPADATEVVIEGGNHAQFGDYGEQAGDGAAAISAGEQRDQAISAIRGWI